MTKSNFKLGGCLILYESQVIDAVCSFLKSQGFVIEQRLTEIQRGDDIRAKKDNLTFYIEAKGETSSKSHTKNYGKEFKTAQVRSHVSAALYKSCEVLTEHSQDPEVRVGIAFPDNEKHKKYVDRIRCGIEKLGITLFWVDQAEQVRTEYF